MLDLTIGNAIAAAVPLVTGAWVIYQEIQRRREAHKLSTDADIEKHKVSVEAELEKQKTNIEAEARKEEAKQVADVEKEKARQQAEVDKIREKGMGGEAVVKIWQAVDRINDNVLKLEENQARDHADGQLIKEIVTRLHGEVSTFTKLIFENLTTRR